MVVQVVVLAEDSKIQDLLKEQGINIPSCAEIAPVQVIHGKEETSIHMFMKMLQLNSSVNHAKILSAEIRYSLLSLEDQR